MELKKCMNLVLVSYWDDENLLESHCGFQAGSFMKVDFIHEGRNEAVKNKKVNF